MLNNGLTLGRGSSASILDSEHASPLGKVAAVSLVLLASLGKAVQTLCGAFVLRSEKWDNSLVDLDSEEDTTRGKVIDESFSFVVLLVDGLVEKNNATDGLFKSLGGGEKQLSVLHSVLFVVLDSDRAVIFEWSVQRSSKKYLSRLPIVPVDSSAARIPFPLATICLAIRASSAWSSGEPAGGAISSLIQSESFRIYFLW